MTNIELARALHDLWNTGNLDLIEQVYAHNFVAHWPPSSEVPERRGLEGIRFGITRIRSAFPDWHEEVLDMFGSSDRVVTRYISTGTHLGPFWGIAPTGRRIEMHEISIFRCSKGRIVEQWRMCDDLARLQCESAPSRGSSAILVQSSVGFIRLERGGRVADRAWRDHTSGA